MTKPKKTETPKRPVGRPRISFSKEDLDRIKLLAGIGLSDEEIALVMGFNRKTVERNKKNNEDFVAAIKEGKANIKSRNGVNLIKASDGGNVSAAIWLDKTRFGFREPKEEPVDFEAIKRELQDILNKLDDTK